MKTLLTLFTFCLVACSAGTAQESPPPVGTSPSSNPASIPSNASTEAEKIKIDPVVGYDRIINTVNLLATLCSETKDDPGPIVNPECLSKSLRCVAPIDASNKGAWLGVLECAQKAKVEQ